MPMKPKAGESQSEFMARCVPEMMGDDKRPQDQAVAACMTMWRDKDKNAEGGVAGRLRRPRRVHGRLHRRDRRRGGVRAGMGRARRQAGRPQDPRLGRRRAGIHPVGRDAGPHGRRDRGRGLGPGQLQEEPGRAVQSQRRISRLASGSICAPQTASCAAICSSRRRARPTRIDEIRALVEADILRAVSVGFLPRQSEPLTKNGGGGLRFQQTELVETSLVSIPANPNALAVARSLNISRDTVAMVFAGQGNRKDRSVGASRFQRRASRKSSCNERTGPCLPSPSELKRPSSGSFDCAIN